MPARLLPDVEHEPSIEEWRRLYSAAVAFLDVAPWRSVSEKHLLGVRDPVSGEIAWCCVLGKESGHPGLAVFPGRQGLEDHGQKSGGYADPDEAGLRHRCLRLQLGDARQADAHDRKIHRELGLRFNGTRNWPLFRSQYPFYFPWHLDREEARLLALCLDQVAAVAAEPKAFRPDSQGRLRVRVTEDPAGRTGWRDERVVPPARPAALAPAPSAGAPPDPARVDRLLAACSRTHQVWEVDAFHSSAVVHERGKRPYFAPTFLAVDRASRMVLQSDMTQPPLAPAFIRDQMLETIESLGLLPREVAVLRESVQRALEPLARALSIHLVRVDRLGALLEARAGLEAALAR